MGDASGECLHTAVADLFAISLYKNFLPEGSITTCWELAGRDATIEWSYLLWRVVRAGSYLSEPARSASLSVRPLTVYMPVKSTQEAACAPNAPVMRVPLLQRHPFTTNHSQVFKTRSWDSERKGERERSPTRTFEWRTWHGLTQLKEYHLLPTALKSLFCFVGDVNQLTDLSVAVRHERAINFRTCHRSPSRPSFSAFWVISVQVHWSSLRRASREEWRGRWRFANSPLPLAYCRILWPRERPSFWSGGPQLPTWTCCSIGSCAGKATHTASLHNYCSSLWYLRIHLRRVSCTFRPWQSSSWPLCQSGNCPPFSALQSA